MTGRVAVRPRFLLVGAGVIGAHHAAVMSRLTEQLDLVAVVDAELDRAQGIASRHGATAHASLTEALINVAVDVVVVATPTGRHREVAIEALTARKHVILEKPAETTVARTDDIIEARRQSGCLVSVISQHRFDAATEVVLTAIGAGELGRLTSGIATIDWWRGQSYYDSGAWRGTWALDGGGALMNQGVHTIDLLVAALGRPVEVFAYTAALAHERLEVEDVAVGVIRFAGGALGVVHASTAAYPGLSARLQIHGDRGSAVIDNDVLTFLHTTPPGADRQDRAIGTLGDALNQADRHPEATVASLAAGSTPGQLSDAHRRQYLNVLAALGGKEALRVTLEMNRQSISVIEGLYRSARTGGAVALT